MPNNVLSSGLPVHVIVTAEALDEEMRVRIARHQADRPTGWTVVRRRAGWRSRWRPKQPRAAAWWSTA
jgi:adenosyl cobinamide kinase/adenosyl cobinamide phosphate guanylyltransferase